jgi:hypothetical protein
LNRGPTTLLRLDRRRTATSRALTRHAHASVVLGLRATHRPRPHTGRGVLLPHAPRPEAWVSSRPHARHRPHRTGSVRAADRRSVGGTPPYARRSRWSCYDGISVVTAASLGRFFYKNRAMSRPPRATPSHRPPLPPSRRARLVPAQPSRPATFRPPLGPPIALGITHCLAKSPTCRRTEPTRPPPPAIAVRPLRQLLRPNSGRPQALGEQVDVSHHFPGRERGRLAGIRLPPPPPHGRGPDCNSPSISRVFSLN